MAERPDLATNPLNWASNGTADKVDPGIAKQGEGWVDFEPLNNGHLNEMLNRYGEMLEYIDGSNLKHIGHVKGVGGEGLVDTFSPTALSMSIQTPFTVNTELGYEFDFSGLVEITVTGDAVSKLWVIYVDNSGVIQALSGTILGTETYLPKPLPDGALLFAILVGGGWTDFSTPPLIYLDLRSRNPRGPYRFIDEAFDKMGDMEVALVWDPIAEQQLNTSPLSLNRIMNPIVAHDGGGTKTTSTKNTCAVTGTGVIYAGDSTNNMRMFDRDLGSTSVEYVWQQANTAGPKKVVTDGIGVAGIHDTFVEVFDIDGTPVWDYDHTAEILDLHMTRNHVYICGAEDGGGISLRKIDRFSGVVEWSFDHGFAVYSVWSDDRAVHMDGGVSTHATGSTFRILNKDGHDVTGEGGIGIDTEGIAVDDVDISLSPQQYGFAEAPDGQLYRISTNGSKFRIAEHGRRPDFPGATGSIPVGRYIEPGSTDFTCISVDHEFIFIPTFDSTIACISRKTMRVVNQIDISSVAIDHIFGTATDGQMLFLDRGLIAGLVKGSSRMRANRYPTRYQKFENPIKNSGSSATSENARLLMQPID